MPASYPSSAKSFTTKTAGQSIDANHVNDLQLEVAAMESDILAGLPVARGGTGNTSLTANRVLLGNGTSAVAVAGAGTAGQVLTSNGASAPTFQGATAARHVVQGRLTLTSGTAVTTGDVTGASTIYYALYNGNQIGLYSGSSWELMTIAELSISTSGGTASKPHDLFVDYNGGTPALALVAWTNDTTRATALTTQDGILVKTGNTSQRYVGTVYLDGSKNCADSLLNRCVWNHYNRVDRLLRVVDATNSWNYSLAAWHQANASAANQVELVIGVSEDVVQARVDAFAVSSAADYAMVGIGLDVTNAIASGSIVPRSYTGSENSVHGSWTGYPGIGRHLLTWIEATNAGGTTTWYGDNNAPTFTQSGLQAVMRG